VDVSESNEPRIDGTSYAALGQASVTTPATASESVATATRSTTEPDGSGSYEGAGNNGGPQVMRPPTPAHGELEKQLQVVLASEVGISAMLTRLKQSVASAKELAHFLRKRAVLEDDHATGIRKLCRMTQENLHRPDHREGTFRAACDEMMAIHERLADNGVQYAHTLHQMYNDLAELCEVAERNRKGWKTTGMAAEDRVAELEQATKKSKAKYDALAEEYDRARTGDARPGGKISLFKMSKSLAQQEEDLLRKLQGADQIYYGQVQTLQSERAKLLATTRPEAVKALRELITETDAVVALQLQKFSAFSEKLLLSDGLIIRPLAEEGINSQQQRGLHEAATIVDSSKDLADYILAHHGRVPPNQVPIEYEKHPILTGMGLGARPLQASPDVGTSAAPPLAAGQTQIRTEAPKSTMHPAIATIPLSSPHPSHHESQHRELNQHPPPMGPVMVAQSLTGSSQIPEISSPQQARPSSSQQQRQRQQQWQPEQLQPPQVPSQLQHHTRSLSQNATNSSSMGRDIDPQHHFAQQPAPATSFLASRGPPQLGALPFQAELSLDPSSSSQLPNGGQRHDHVTSEPPPLVMGHERRDSNTNVANTPLHTQSVTPVAPVSGGLASNNGGNNSELMQTLPSFNSSNGSPNFAHGLPAGRAPGKMFHLSLAALYERDNNPVPLVVNQCIQAVELFGLNVEGIYRQSGSMNHINSMKVLFDKDPHNQALDFRRPDKFHHDINSVAGLLKQFFRDLPDPLLTQARYQEFILAASKFNLSCNWTPGARYHVCCNRNAQRMF
jgi:hypothetical protein